MLTALHHPVPGAGGSADAARGATASLRGLRVAYVGDANNVARSLAVLGSLAGMHVALASPAGYTLEDELELPAGASARVASTAIRTRRSRGAQAVYTDVWVSMGDEAHRRASAAARSPRYRVDDALLDAAAPGAFAMHDLPAHPGEEIIRRGPYGSRQRIWDQAENRRHAQKALLEWLVPSPSACRRRDVKRGWRVCLFIEMCVRIYAPGHVSRSSRA